MNAQDENINVGQTPLSPAQIRAILRLHSSQAAPAPDVGTLGDLAKALDIPIEQAAELLNRVESSSASVESHAPAPQPKKGPALLNQVSLILSFLGIFLSGVLSLGHFFARSIPCGEGGGCDIVASNPASMVFGVSVAYLGCGAYVMLALISSIRAVRGVGSTQSIGMIALGLSGIGALFSFYLQYLSFTQIHATCLWCLGSALTMCVLFLMQAGMAQAETSQDSRGMGSSGVVVGVGLSLLVLLGLGFEAETIVSHGAVLVGIANNDETSKLLLTPDSMRLGPDTAPIRIVEFSDLVCPSCKAEYADVKERVLSSKGRIQLILRHRPLTKNPDHKMALPAAFFAEVASEKGKGWQFVDAMYAHDNEELQTQDSINAIAKKVGLDVDDLLARYKNTNDPAYKRVLRDLNAAQVINVTETPTFVIFAKGQQPTAALGFQMLSALKEPRYKDLIDGK
jgi:protein-disulfide isomerase/uncharacterized membrane protein